MSSTDAHWSRMIALVDMNCFFAAVEQQDHVFWQNKPIAVTNGQQGTTIITCSYEARRFGVTTGMRLKQARALCPNLIQAPSRPERYAEMSSMIMQALTDISPDVEVYSVDEAFLDLTRCQYLYRDVHEIGRYIKAKVHEVSGLSCSVGISGDKTTAKFAAKQEKPDGFVVIHPDEAEARLSRERVTEISGINKGIARFLEQYGVIYCCDMKHIPMSLLAKRFGNLGRRIWLMAQGKDPEPMHYNVKPPKSIGHGKVMPPQTRDVMIILTYLQHMSEKVAMRMRCFNYQASVFFIGIKTDKEWLKTKAKLGFYTDDGAIIYQLCKQFLSEYWKGQGIKQVQVTALEPIRGRQLDLFHTETEQKQRQQLNTAMDNVNQRYGELSLMPARLINRSSMPNVIAPAWKPHGLRKTI